MKKLGQRKETLLQATIKEYIKNAKPISSKHLKRTYNYELSTATIRNILADLEDEGFLTHPHTSAGRIPTAKGYRYYVGICSGKLSLGLDKRRYIIDFFENEEGLDELLKITSTLLSQITPYLGVVARFYQESVKIKHIDLVSLSGSKVMLVIITNTGEVLKDRVLVSRYDFNLERLEEILNKELVGLDISSVKLKCESLANLQILGQIYNEVSQKLIELLINKNSVLHYDGISNLLKFQEFSEANLISGILSVLKNGFSVLKRISENIESEYFIIAIGKEFQNLSLGNASLIAAPYYQSDEIAGIVGAIGPMRMDYGNAMAATECVAGVLSNTLKQLK